MDIDIDTPSKFNPASIFPTWVRASMRQDDGTARPHPCGVHPISLPTDPFDGLSVIDHSDVETLGGMKLDFLHLHVYDHFKSRAEIEALLKVPPKWELLKSKRVCDQLFQNLGSHFDIVSAVSPTSVRELADVLALIRPKKRFLLKYYADPASREWASQKLYEIDESGYQFKLSHSIAYALVIVLQLHLIDCGVEFL